MKICIIGLGEIGYNNALYILERIGNTDFNISLFGYDIAPKVVHKALDIGVAATWNGIPKSDVYLVSVTTDYTHDDIDVSAVMEVCKQIAEIDPNPHLLSIESTIPPGLTYQIWKEIFNKDAHIAHVPHRYWKYDPENRGVNVKRLVSAIDNCTLAIANDFYTKILGMETQIVRYPEIAELAKIVENAYKFELIAIAEHLSMLCEELPMVTFDELKKAVDSHPAIPPLMEVRDGIGGHCLPMAIRWLEKLSSRDKFAQAFIDIDSRYKEMRE